MYIEKYWGSYIGGSDDSLTLLDYLIDKQKEEITLSEIFSDTGLDKLKWNFTTTEPGLCYKDRNGMEHEVYFAIDLVTDLAALMLECQVNGSVSIGKLRNDEDSPNVRILSTDEEKESMNKALADFIQNPLDYDLSEMVPDEGMRDMALECECIRKELYTIPE